MMLSPLLPAPITCDNRLTATHLLAPRGEPLAAAVHRPADALPDAADAFVERWRAAGPPPPCFPHRAVHFAWVELPAALLLFTYSSAPFSPAYVLDALYRMAAVLADFLGGLTEAAVRRNHFLVLELFDEMVDDGYVVTTDVQLLRSCVAHEPLASKVARPPADGEWRSDAQDGPCTMSRLSLADRGLRTAAGCCDVCVDVEETLSVTLLPDGQPCHAVVLGQLTVRALFGRRPALVLQLNPAIALCPPSDGPHSSTAVLFASHTLHPAVSRAEWELSRTLRYSPSLGTSVPLRYRVTDRLRLPLQVHAVAERTSPDTVEVLIRLQPRLEVQAGPCRVALELPLPAGTVDATSGVELAPRGSDTFEFWRSKLTAHWVLEEVQLSRERLARCTVRCPGGVAADGFGPLRVRFTIAGHSATGFVVQSVEVEGGPQTSNLRKWLRTRCVAGEYVAHLVTRPC
eukprot:EG_transcript_10404